MSTLGQLAEWLVRLTEGDAGPSPAARTESHGGRLESLRRVIGAYARLHRPEPESEPCEVLFRWGHLEVLERIGSGSYGEVYRAFDGVLERDVALKLRRSEQVAARAYILEARRLARVRHPNVLAIHGAAVNDGRVGMWADLIDGRTLSAWVAENGPRSRAEVLEAGRMLASALAAVHRAGLIHGDVKPGNIMRGADGGLVLMDFGAAIERAAGGAQATLGSPLTMAPEQLDGSPIGPAADLYALGVVLFQLATGRYPLEATSIDGLAGLHARGAAVDPEPLVRALGRAPTRLIERLLARDPAARPSAEETLDALREIERAPQRRQKRLAVGAVIVALVLALVASGIGYIKVSDEARRAEEIKNFTLSLFDRANVFHVANRGEVSAADLLRGGVERVEKELVGEPRVQAELLTTIASGLHSLGAADDAKAAGQTALRLLEQAASTDPNAQAQALAILGSLARDSGELDEAQAYYERALALSERGGVPEEGHFAILTGLSMVAGLRGDRERSLALMHRILRERIALRGPEDPDVGLDYQNLGTYYYDLDRYAEAEQSYRKGRAIVTKALGPDHTTLFFFDQALATMLRLEGRLEEAEHLIRDTAERMRARGLTSPEIYAIVLRTWAGILRHRHRADEGLPLVAEALGYVQPGQRVANQAVLLQERGRCLAALERWNEAERALAQAVSVYASANILPRRRWQAHAERYHAAWKDRRAPAAMSEIGNALERIEELVGTEGDEWLTTARLLAVVLRDQGRVDEALDLFEQVRERTRAIDYMGPIGIARADADIALAIAARKDVPAAAAGARLDEALAALTTVDPQHPLREELIAARASLPVASQEPASAVMP